MNIEQHLAHWGYQAGGVCVSMSVCARENESECVCVCCVCVVCVCARVCTRVCIMYMQLSGDMILHNTVLKALSMNLISAHQQETHYHMAVSQG